MIPTDLASVAVPNMIKTDAGCYFGTLMILNILIGIESVCKDMIKSLLECTSVFCFLIIYRLETVLFRSSRNLVEIFFMRLFVIPCMNTRHFLGMVCMTDQNKSAKGNYTIAGDDQRTFLSCSCKVFDTYA